MTVSEILVGTPGHDTYELHDLEQLEEIALLSTFMVAAGTRSTRLSRDEVDALLRQS